MSVTLTQILAAVSVVENFPLLSVKSAIDDPVNLGNNVATVEAVLTAVSIVFPAAEVAAEVMAALAALAGLAPEFPSKPDDPIRDAQTSEARGGRRR